MRNPSLPHTARARRSPGAVRLPLLTGALLPLLLSPGVSARAAELLPSDGGIENYFGHSSSVSGRTALVGAYHHNDTRGAAYLYRYLGSVGSSATQDVKLTLPGGAPGDYFGACVSLSGNMALVGSARLYANSVYLFRHLDTLPAGSVITPEVKLVCVNTSPFERMIAFGTTVHLSGNMALVKGASWEQDDDFGYIYRDLDTAPAGSSIQQSHRLIQPYRGTKFTGTRPNAGLSGNIALMASADRGEAYLYRGLDTVRVGWPVFWDVILSSSDRVSTDLFGNSAVLSGDTALVGAELAASGNGAAYLYRGVSAAPPGGRQEDARLIASDGAAESRFGGPLSLSGNTALIGADRHASQAGAAYLFRNLDTAGGTVMESVRLRPAVASSANWFGSSTALDGDRFVIGASQGSESFFPGKAFTGLVSAFTVLDTGGAVRATEGLSFVSREDWVIGERTDGNRNTLGPGAEDSADVTVPGTGVYVGRNAGSDGNVLTIVGSLTTGFVRVGAAGNTGNALSIRNSGLVNASAGVAVASGSAVGGDGSLKGNLTLAPGALWAFLSTAPLRVTGAVSLPHSFGVTSLLPLTGSTPAGAYPLIESAGADFAAMGLSHWGQANAHDLGGGKTAWLTQEGSVLRLVVAGGDPPVEVPVLGISRVSAAVTLTWTTTLPGLIPESAAALSGPWETIAAAPARNGDTYTLTVPAASARAFYRLRIP